MQTNVLPFPQSKLTDFGDIPTPADMRPGDSYLRVDVRGDIFAQVGLFDGAVLVVLINATPRRGPHLVVSRGRTFVAQVATVTTDAVTLCPWETGARPQTYPLSEIAVVGLVTIIYPFGVTGPSWTCHYPEDPALPASMEYPLINVAAH